jgi:hypothetical protein
VTVWGASSIPVVRNDGYLYKDRSSAKGGREIIYRGLLFSGLNGPALLL